MCLMSSYVSTFCRLDAMNTISRSGYNPSLELWEEPDTILHGIIATPTEDCKSGQQYNVYFASEAELGRPQRIKALTTSGRYRHLVRLDLWFTS